MSNIEAFKTAVLKELESSKFDYYCEFSTTPENLTNKMLFLLSIAPSGMCFYMFDCEICYSQHDATMYHFILEPKQSIL